MRKNRMLTKCAAVILAGCMTAALLVGCSEEKVDYQLGTEETNGGNAGSLTQFADEAKWSDEWNVPLAGGETLQLSVDANVVVPEVSAMSVVEVEETVVDAEYKKHFMSVMFDNGEIYYHDAAHHTKAEWEDEIAELEARIAINEEIIHSQQGFNQDEMASAEAWLDSLKEELQECRSYHQSAAEDYTPADSFDGCNEFIGHRDEVPYFVNFGMNDEGTVSVIRVECMDKLACGPSSLQEYDGVDIFGEQYRMEDDVNECALSMEEAKQIADQFADGIGRSYQVCYQTEEVWWEAYNEIEGDPLPQIVYEEDAIFGYRFVYGTGVDGRAFAEYGGMTVFDNFGAKVEDTWESVEEIPEGFYDSKDRLSIVVTDAGVVDVTMDYPVTVTNVTEQVELLPLDTVKGIMKNEVMEHADDYDFSQSKYYNTLELIYFRLKNDDKKGSYSYVPVWCLSGKVAERRNHGVLVNAIDGSVIYVEDEI